MGLEKTGDATQMVLDRIPEAKQLQEVRYLFYSILGLSSKNCIAQLKGPTKYKKKYTLLEAPTLIYLPLL